jgi:hypothetical protein
MITMNNFKAQFFDKERLREWHKQVNKGIIRTAALTRTIAKRSIKKPGVKQKKSNPGEAPRYHTRLLKDHIYFWANRKTMSAEIGPARLIGTASQNIPGDLEQGRSGLKPRPYMGPALDIAKDTLKDVLTG